MADKRSMALLCLLFFAFAIESRADILSAHYGTTDPTTENFSYSTFNGPAGYVGQATDQGRPTWEITSGSPSSQIYYTSPGLSSAQLTAIATQGFTETLVARVESNGVAPAYDQYPAPIGWTSVGLGSIRWDIDLGINSNGDTVVNLPTTVGYGSQPGVVVDTGPTYTLSDAAYHTYQLYYSPTTNSASLYIDGILVLPGYTGETAYTGNWGLYWGVQNGGLGFFNEVQLETGNDIVPPTTAVPEPSSLIVAAGTASLALLGLLKRRQLSGS